MNSGRVVSIAIIALTAAFGAALWYSQTRAYYERIEMAALPLTLASGEEFSLEPDMFTGIDADTSPLRFRGCFSVAPDVAARVIADGVPAVDPTPLIAPAWFDCYDANIVGADLEAGRAIAVLATPEIARGVDRIIALYPDGRGFAWHQLNGSLE